MNTDFIKSKKFIVISTLLVAGLQILGVFLSLTTDTFGNDFGIFYREVEAFWNGEEIYNEGFFYLNYFFILYGWIILFPIQISIFIHIGISTLLYYIIVINLDNYHHYGWFLGNFFLFLLWLFIINTNILVIFSLIMYQKKRDKFWAPFLLILSFYKITVVLVFGLIFLINLIYEKKIYWNQIPALIITILIILISFVSSYDGLVGSALSYGDLGIAFQSPHFVWWSIPIMVFSEQNEYSESAIKRICVIFFILQIVYIIMWYLLFDFFKIFEGKKIF